MSLNTLIEALRVRRVKATGLRRVPESGRLERMLELFQSELKDLEKRITQVRRVSGGVLQKARAGDLQQDTALWTNTAQQGRGRILKAIDELESATHMLRKIG